LEQGDWIIASIHYGQQQSREQITDRLLRAIRNPHVDQIAHPTGRLLNRRPPYQVDMDAVMQAAVEFGKCLELNASPKRLDLNVEHLRQARLLGIPIVINTDAHSPRGLDAMRYGINQARRAGLTADDVLNCRDLADWLPEG
jgi:DNA polymerase (family 10)